MLAIIQARLNSKRLPGKVLMEINGKPLIRYMVERLQGIKLVIAVPEKDYRPISDAVDCRVIGCPGDENDVRARYLYVTTKLEPPPERFIRLCADSPLIDPAVVKYVWSHNQCTMTTNTQPRTWPKGQCVEAMHHLNFMKSPNYHRMGKREPMTAEDKEHVTPWYYRNNPFENVTNPAGDFSHVNMCVDTQEDFDRMAAVIGKMDRPHTEYGWRELVDMFRIVDQVKIDRQAFDDAQALTSILCCLS